MMHIRSLAGLFVSFILLIPLFATAQPPFTALEVRASGGSFGGGDGTEGNPYLIEDIDDLQAMNNNLTAHYALANNIDASVTSTWNAGAGFVPVAGNDPTSTPVNKFTGSFDGRGYTITGLYIYRPDSYNIGLFGHIGDNILATIVKNINLVDTTVTGARGAGTLIGRVTGNANTIIEKCSSLGGSVTGNGATGGLIGSHNSYQETPGGANNPIARYCFVDVDVFYSALNLSGADDKGDKFGGLAGCGQKGTVSNCFARGSVTHSGGGTLHERIGGLTGCSLLRGQLINSYSTGLVTVTDCADYGGLVGNLSKGGNAGTATNSFWDTETSGQATSGGGTGKTTAEMKTEATFTGAGWDFTNVWGIEGSKNDGYPHLLWYYDVAPSISAIGLYQIDHSTSVTAISPQTEYAVKVTVNCAATLANLTTVKVVTFYDADGIYAPEDVPSSGNTQTTAILTCTVGETPSWSIDAGAGSTWSIISGDCVQPTLANTTGDFWFHFKAGKVATATTSGAKWHIYAQATSPAGSTDNYQANLTMNWYGEITVNTLSVDFGTVIPGSDFIDNSVTVISVTFICNGNYNQQIKVSSPWTGSGYSAFLKSDGNPGEGEFSLKADNTATLESAALVSTDYATIGTGTQTGENGNNESANTLWLKLGALGMPAVTYDGTIYYGIAQ